MSRNSPCRWGLAVALLLGCYGQPAFGPRLTTSRDVTDLVLIIEVESFVGEPDVVELELLRPQGTPTKEELKLDPRAHGFARFPVNGWYSGPGQYRVQLTYLQPLLFTERLLEAAFLLEGKEEGVELTLSVDGKRGRGDALRVDILEPAPAVFGATPAWEPSADGAGGYEVHNRSPSPVMASEILELERRVGGEWALVPAHERGAACRPDRSERQLGPGAAVRVEEWSNHCGLRPLDPGTYRHTARLWPTAASADGVRHVWRLHFPFEVSKPAGSQAMHMKHAFADAPIASLRLGAYVSVSGVFTAEIFEPTTRRASCVCRDALVGKEAWRVTALGGQCLYLAGPEIDERTCIPSDPDLRGDPAPEPPGERFELR